MPYDPAFPRGSPLRSITAAKSRWGLEQRRDASSTQADIIFERQQCCSPGQLVRFLFGCIPKAATLDGWLSAGYSLLFCSFWPMVEDQPWLCGAAGMLPNTASRCHFGVRALRGRIQCSSVLGRDEDTVIVLAMHASV